MRCSSFVGLGFFVLLFSACVDRDSGGGVDTDANVGAGTSSTGVDDTDGGSSGGVEPGETTGTAGTQHPACTSAAPSPLPALPSINTDAAGRPNFDLWRDQPCGGGAYLCGAAGSAAGCPTQSICLQSDPSIGGVCTYGDSDTSCDGEGEVIGYGDGTCWMCASIEAHSDACCAALPGFDCRAWPYPADGTPGMVCARHEDCEPGLVCGSGSYSKGYGICQCPGLSGDGLSPGPNCGF